MAGRKFSRCPRCGGNMFLDKDDGGWFEECLQCSTWRAVDHVDILPGRQGEAGGVSGSPGKTVITLLP